MKYISCLCLLLICWNCSQDEPISNASRHDLWLLHKGAELPVVVEGNTNSKIFLLLLHGGPGGSAQEYNQFSKPFTDVIEEDYAMVYYDQRNAGLARGDWDIEKLTIEQHIEDLDKIIDLLEFKFGSDIKIFLSGHSWGGYLGTAYALSPTRQSRIKAWINIDGNTNRNRRNKDNLVTIFSIATEQIFANSNVDKWSALRKDVQTEFDKNISLYDDELEGEVNKLASRAEVLINMDELLDNNSSSGQFSIYSDNYDPVLILANDRKGTLIEQMYAFDATMNTSLSSIEIPVLSIYGKYDVITSSLQGQYLMDNISTSDEDKRMVILDKSGHSCMLNEPLILAEEIKKWIARYK